MDANVGIHENYGAGSNLILTSSHQGDHLPTGCCCHLPVPAAYHMLGWGRGDGCSFSSPGGDYGAGDRGRGCLSSDSSYSSFPIHLWRCHLSSGRIEDGPTPTLLLHLQRRIFSAKTSGSRGGQWPLLFSCLPCLPVCLQRRNSSDKFGVSDRFSSSSLWTHSQLIVGLYLCAWLEGIYSPTHPPTHCKEFSGRFPKVCRKIWYFLFVICSFLFCQLSKGAS